MKDILKQYLSKHLTCPFGKAAAKEDLIHYLDHHFLSDTEKIDQKPHIEEYKKFLLDRRINTSLIVVLEDKEPINVSRESLENMHIDKQKEIITSMQDYLHTVLWDVIVWFDMANKNCHNTEEWSKKLYSPTPSIESQYELHSGAWRTVDQFIDTLKKYIVQYTKVPIIALHWCNTYVTDYQKETKEKIKNISSDITLTPAQEQYRRELQAQNRYLSSFLMLYMGPLYPENHARYTPKHNIVINNYDDISSIKNEYREEVMKKIKNQSELYDIRYFPSPV